mmetsp:Transcript_85478/g.151199  ORF Transcript_85478/g.151199 Transcript_85478/m.151199 type:complete len:528 (-) Transcript_85478:92-1675(-)|eukprot:CAMPEP_0197651894 /NCGR_PEP_ID=MMETSP1338-20131121/34116_1 /TAXON_ID=43686 ORGANISM="Pelagodinium beii, Strain RCC1491" /NCGR_SAMPLE_ID=MMETSP1338 /ASSEMBLY_ACC=CAM_ASM_000754 /LENGTH=527 /DNA_ID=CAMNT_0043226655 /DNA_START=190 /DNA_END=1773 /DNA_ORIENTATION=+
MELATALVWTLRIVLPIILFCIYFKFQSKEPGSEASYASSSGKGRIPRSKLLAHRKVAKEDPTVPESLATLTLKDQTQAPSLFQSGGDRGGGGKGGRGSRPGREDRGGQKGERREKREPKDKEQPEKSRASLEAKRQQVIETIPPDEGAAATPAAEGAAEMSANQEKMNLESLLNFVAFNRKDQQRSFIVDEEVPPPPPPKLASLSAEPSGPLKAEALDLTKTTAEKANAEAQMVLRGALNFKRVDIAKDLYEQLSACNIEISESTFTLMIEASVIAKDLKSSSDFLMKMETSGHSPATDLLDKVLDLYSNQKTQREQEKQNSQARQVPTAALGDFGYQEVAMPAERTKLTSASRPFVPSFGIPPPPPKPPTVDKPLAEADSEGKNEEAAEKATTADGSAEAAAGLERTKLTAAAKPFEPLWNGGPKQEFVGWDAGLPMPNPWDGGYNSAEDYFMTSAYDNYKKGKGSDGAVKDHDDQGGKHGYEKGRGKGKANKGKINDSNDAGKGGPVKKWKPKEVPGETVATAA